VTGFESRVTSPGRLQILRHSRRKFRMHSLCRRGVIMRITKLYFHSKHTSFKPTFTLTQMEAFWTVGANVSPTTLVPIWTLHALWKSIRKGWGRSRIRSYTILEPVTRGFLRIVCQRNQLFRSENVVVWIFADASLIKKDKEIVLMTTNVTDSFWTGH
jgi:hypothetical protein